MCHRAAQSLAFGYRSYSEYDITINRSDPECLIPSDASKVSVSSTPKSTIYQNQNTIACLTTSRKLNVPNTFTLLRKHERALGTPLLRFSETNLQGPPGEENRRSRTCRVPWRQLEGPKLVRIVQNCLQIIQTLSRKSPSSSPLVRRPTVSAAPGQLRGWVEQSFPKKLPSEGLDFLVGSCCIRSLTDNVPQLIDLVGTSISPRSSAHRSPSSRTAAEARLLAAGAPVSPNEPRETPRGGLCGRCGGIVGGGSYYIILFHVPITSSLWKPLLTQPLLPRLLLALVGFAAVDSLCWTSRQLRGPFETRCLCYFWLLWTSSELRLGSFLGGEMLMG